MDPIRICGKCGKGKRPSALLCPRCQDQYRKEALASLQTGRKLSIYDWTKQGLEDRISALENQLSNKKTKLDSLQKEVRREAHETVRELLEGAHLSPEKFRKMLEETRKTIWSQKEGNRLYAELKKLEEELAPQIGAAKILLQTIKEKSVEQILHTTLLE